MYNLSFDIFLLFAMIAYGIYNIRRKSAAWAFLDGVNVGMLIVIIYQLIKVQQGI